MEENLAKENRAKESLEPIVTLTESAAAHIKSLMDREAQKSHKNQKKAYLRISVVGGGCSGFSYKLGFEEVAGENDLGFEQHGVNCLVDKKSSLFLKGIEVDYSDGLNGAGFSYTNPNAKASCGCGTSFSV